MTCRETPRSRWRHSLGRRLTHGPARRFSGLQSLSSFATTIQNLTNDLAALQSAVKPLTDLGSQLTGLPGNVQVCCKCRACLMSRLRQCFGIHAARCLSSAARSVRVHALGSLSWCMFPCLGLKSVYFATELATRTHVVYVAWQLRWSWHGN